MSSALRPCHPSEPPISNKIFSPTIARKSEVKGMIVKGISLETLLHIPLTIIPVTTPAFPPSIRHLRFDCALPRYSAIPENCPFLAKLSKSSCRMATEKFSMTNFQFRLCALVAACRAAPWRPGVFAFISDKMAGRKMAAKKSPVFMFLPPCFCLSVWPAVPGAFLYPWNPPSVVALILNEQRRPPGRPGNIVHFLCCIPTKQW
jgi:hypothetical protein